MTTPKGPEASVPVIDQRVVSLAQNFRTHFERRLGAFPKYRLDYSWPSVGLVDLLLSDLVRKTDRLKTDDNVILGAAAYLSVVAAGCWNRFPDNPKIELRFAEEPAVEVLLEARGGTHLPAGERAVVQFVTHLSRIFIAPDDPFPFFEQALYTLRGQDPLASLFTLGVAGGVSPHIVGPWAKKTHDEMLDYLSAARDELSITSALYYREVFPSEPYGTDPDIYRAGSLTLPPSQHEDDRPYLRATYLLIEHLQGRKMERTDVQSLALNLSQSPDTTFANVGYALSVALQTGLPSERLCALSEALDMRRLYLKPAVCMARDLFGLPATPFALLDTDQEGAALLFAAERILGLTPLLRVPPLMFADDRYRPLLEHLYWGRAGDARAFLVERAADGTLTPAAAIQRVLVELALNDTAGAAAAFESAESVLADSDPVLRPLRAELEGYLELKRNNADAACAAFLRAAAAESCDTYTRQLVRNLAAETLLTQNKIQEARELLTSVVAEPPYSLRAAIQLTEIELYFGSDENLGEMIEKLVLHAPFVYRVLNAVLWHQTLIAGRERKPAAGEVTEEPS